MSNDFEVGFYNQLESIKPLSKEELLIIKELVENEIQRKGLYSKRFFKKFGRRANSSSSFVDGFREGIQNSSNISENKSGRLSKNDGTRIRGLKYSKYLDNKTFENLDWYKKQLEKERPSWIKDYEYKVIDIERLVKDNDLGDGRLVIRWENYLGNIVKRFRRIIVDAIYENDGYGRRIYNKIESFTEYSDTISSEAEGSIRSARKESSNKFDRLHEETKYRRGRLKYFN